MHRYAAHVWGPGRVWGRDRGCQTVDRRFRRLGSLVATMGLLALLSGGLLTSVASASRAQTGSLTMTSDEGDYIGQGRQWSYDTSAHDVFDSTSTGRTIQVGLQAANADWWYLNLAAPEGQTLAAGAYDSATRYPFQGPGAPGLDVSGNGRGCNTLTGSFTVTEVTFGPFGALESFAADFVQHCEGGEPALRGHLQIVLPPAPAPLAIGLGLAAEGTTDRAGGATVSETVTCNTPTAVYVHATLRQRANRFTVASGQFVRQVACTGTTAWQSTVRSDNGVPYNPGSAELDVYASAYDTYYGRSVDATRTGTVKLRR